MNDTKKSYFFILFCFSIFALALFDTLQGHAYTSSLAFTVYSSGWAHDLLKIITFLGNELVVGLNLVFIFILLYKEKNYKSMIYCLITVFTVIAVTALFKHLIDSPRPHPFSVETDSFPSGHTVRVTLWCGLYFMLDRLKAIQLPDYGRWILVLTAVLVGYSRLGLGRHWFSDVIGGYSLTLGLIALICVIASPYHRVIASSYRRVIASSYHRVIASRRRSNPENEN